MNVSDGCALFGQFCFSDDFRTVFCFVSGIKIEYFQPQGGLLVRGLPIKGGFSGFLKSISPIVHFFLKLCRTYVEYIFIRVIFHVLNVFDS